MLRCANLIGPRIETSLTRYFALPVIPTVLGFDARLQFCHEDDALAVARAATLTGPHGTFNVAGDGVLMLSQAVRRLGRPSVPMPAFALSSLVVGPSRRPAGRADRRTGRVPVVRPSARHDAMRSTLGFEPDVHDAGGVRGVRPAAAPRPAQRDARRRGRRADHRPGSQGDVPWLTLTSSPSEGVASPAEALVRRRRRPHVRSHRPTKPARCAKATKKADRAGTRASPCRRAKPVKSVRAKKPAARADGERSEQVTIDAEEVAEAVDRSGPLDASAMPTGSAGWPSCSAFLRHRVTGDYEVDEFGFDAEVTDHFVLTALRPLAQKWFRIESAGSRTSRSRAAPWSCPTTPARSRSTA